MSDEYVELLDKLSIIASHGILRDQCNDVITTVENLIRKVARLEADNAILIGQLDRAHDKIDYLQDKLEE